MPEAIIVLFLSITFVIFVFGFLMFMKAATYSLGRKSRHSGNSSYASSYDSWYGGYDAGGYDVGSSGCHDSGGFDGGGGCDGGGFDGGSF